MYKQPVDTTEDEVLMEVEARLNDDAEARESGGGI